MKIHAVILQIALLGLVGCTGQSTPLASSPSQPEPAVTALVDDTAIATLVSLKVPYMH